MYRYEYIALLDIDEVIVPVKHNNWTEMMEEVVKTSLKVKNETRASWNFRNVYFMDEMLDAHEHNHFPLGCLGGVCTSYPVDTGLAHLQHYRQDCVNTLKKSCKEESKSVSVRDTTIWRLKDI